MMRNVFQLQHSAKNPLSQFLLFRSVSYHQNLDLDSIKNVIEQKVKQMKDEQPSIPPQLQQTNSALCMIFDKNKFTESVSLGPTFPSNKYEKYEEFLNLRSKAFIFYFFLNGNYLHIFQRSISCTLHH